MIIIRLFIESCLIAIGVSLYLDKWDWAAWFAAGLLAQIAWSLCDLQERGRK